MKQLKWSVASDHDLDVVVRLENALFKKVDRFSARRLLSLIQNQNAFVLLCWEGKLPIGYGIALRTRLKSGPYKGRIYSLGVIREMRQRGIGERILHALEDWLIKKGATYITLETRFGKNVSYYQKRGYQSVQRLPRYYGVSPGLRMRKNLN